MNELILKKEQRMTSLEIAEVTDKLHKNVMQAIRKMESALEKICGLKFQPTWRAVRHLMVPTLSWIFLHN